MDPLTEDDLKIFVRSGVHIGHRKSKRHPRMLPFVYGMRGNTEIIDVAKTVEALEVAAAFLRERAAQSAVVLFVGTRPSHAETIREVAKRLGAPYVTDRWIGGTITNFAVIAQRLRGFRELAERERSGELAEKYTKAERLRFQRQLARFERELGGIRDLESPPSALVLASLRADQIASREARLRNIPVVAIVDTDADPSEVTYPIPANDDAISSVRMILDRLAAAIEEGRRLQRRSEEPEAGKADESRETP